MKAVPGILPTLLEMICFFSTPTIDVEPKLFKAKAKEKVPKPYDFGTFLGGDNRTRICDLPRVRRTLYRLSYASILEKTAMGKW